MTLEKRLQTLEAKLNANPVVLHFEDGSTQTLYGRKGFLLDLLTGTCGGELSAEQAAQVELIRLADGAEEPGGGRLFELLQALLSGQASNERAGNSDDTVRPN